MYKWDRPAPDCKHTETGDIIETKKSKSTIQIDWSKPPNPVIIRII